MRLAAVVVLFTAVAATSVAAYETNAQRFARGLPPNPPARRGASGTDSAEHHHPSKKPHGDGGHDNNGHDGHDRYGTHETNAQRLARGLPPNPLVRRGASGTDSAEHHHPSEKPPHKQHGDGGDKGDKGDGHNRYETNAQRFARGLPPNPPARRGTSRADSAEHHHPSGKPPVRRAASNTDTAEQRYPSGKPPGGGEDDTKCKTVVQCCNSVSYSSNPVVKTIAGYAKAKLPTDNTPIGLGCSAIGEHRCSAHTVCCEDNNYSGVIAIGCIDISISV